MDKKIDDQSAAALEVVVGMWKTSRNGQSENSKKQLVSITLS